MNEKKPTLTLKQKTPKPPQPVIGEEAYAKTISRIVVEEWERAERNKTVAFEATMARITADDALWQRLATIFISKECRRRIKKLNCANTMRNEAASIEEKRLT
jgi:hypothetical protein